jgi:hypothetical protein
MKCFTCNQDETIDFTHLCQRCTDLEKEKERQERARRKARRYKGATYADICATCNTSTKTVWLVTFKNTLGTLRAKTTGAWCEDCIYEMVGRKHITSAIEFTNIKNVQFIKKLRDPLANKATQDVCEILKSVEF